MKANEFYRILARVQGVRWGFVYNPKTEFGRPARTQFIRGVRHDLWYSPLSVVATAVRRQFVDVSHRNINRVLRLNARTYHRILDATYQRSGYSPAVRRKLLRACRLPS